MRSLSKIETGHGSLAHPRVQYERRHQPRNQRPYVYYDREQEREEPQEKYEMWEQHLNELQDNNAALPPELRLYNLGQYALFIQDQTSLHDYEQELGIDDMCNINYANEYEKSEEILLQNQQWEDIAFVFQQLT